MIRPHVWRYDNAPAEERPWIVSYHHGPDGEIADAPDDFPTWREAFDHAVAVAR